MQGNWNHGKAHYRCRFPNEYAIGNELDHPLAVYVREDAILDPLDAWLAEVFSSDRVDDSLTMLESGQPDIPLAQEDVRRAFAECERKLTRHRAALEAGAAPALVAAWSREVQREKAVLEARLAASDTRSVRNRRMSREEIRELVDSLGGLLAILREADPADKLEVYRQLGLKLTYNHDKRMVVAETQPQPPVCVVLFGAWFNATDPAGARGVFLKLAQAFSQGTSSDIELIAADVSGDLAYTVQREITSTIVNGEPREYALRVTQVYRREGSEWKVVHRHGDEEPEADKGP